MQEVYGPVTAFGVATLVALLTQVLKSQFNLEGIKALLASLVWALIWFVPFHLLKAGLSPVTIYESIFYAFMGALTANGIYSAAATTVREYSIRRQFANLTKDDDPPE